MLIGNLTHPIVVGDNRPARGRNVGGDVAFRRNGNKVGQRVFDAQRVIPDVISELRQFD